MGNFFSRKSKVFEIIDCFSLLSKKNKLLTLITRKILNRSRQKLLTTPVQVECLSLAFFSDASNIFAIIDFFLFSQRTFNAYNSKNTEPIETKITHNTRVGGMTLVGNFFSDPSNIFAIIDLFLFSHRKKI